MQVQSLGREDPWRRAWQPTPVFLSGYFICMDTLTRHWLLLNRSMSPEVQVKGISKFLLINNSFLPYLVPES